MDNEDDEVISAIKWLSEGFIPSPESWESVSDGIWFNIFIYIVHLRLSAHELDIIPLNAPHPLVY